MLFEIRAGNSWKILCVFKMNVFIGFSEKKKTFIINSGIKLGKIRFFQAHELFCHREFSFASVITTWKFM